MAARYSFAEHLGAGLSTAAEIAREESLGVDTTARLLRAAATLGLVTTTDGKKYGTTPILDTLRAEAPGSLRGLALALNQPGHWQPWGLLPDSMVTAEPQSQAALGMPVWDYYDRHPGEAADFTPGAIPPTAPVADLASRRPPKIAGPLWTNPRRRAPTSRDRSPESDTHHFCELFTGSASSQFHDEY